jgi:hypothetical protein
MTAEIDRRKGYYMLLGNVLYKTAEDLMNGTVQAAKYLAVCPVQIRRDILDIIKFVNILMCRLS